MRASEALYIEARRAKHGSVASVPTLRETGALQRPNGSVMDRQYIYSRFCSLDVFTLLYRIGSTCALLVSTSERKRTKKEFLLLQLAFDSQDSAVNGTL
jgi:hypothetical protein